MLWRTHALGGFVLGALGLSALGASPGEVVGGGLVAACTALLPDIDSPHSKLGRMIWPAAWLVRTAVGHRGPLHSLAAAAAVGLIGGLFGLAGLCAAFLGYASHLLLDALNPEGIPLLWPRHIRFRIPLMTTGGVIERFVLFPALLLGSAAFFGELFVKQVHTTLSALMNLF